MINMGYVRFENTFLALEECIDALENNKPLSESEDMYRQSLYEKCKEYIECCECYTPIETEEDEDDF